MTSIKYEWKKQEKEFYLPPDNPRIITVPRHKFFAIKGTGDPNGSDFAERVGVLYSLAYSIRMMPKSGFVPEGYFEYTVYPLEGIWETADIRDKSAYIYTVMIRQPDFVSDKTAARAMETVGRKKPHPFLEEAFLCEMEDGLSVQMMHNGDYDEEPRSFAEMQRFMAETGLIRVGDSHREIYLSDPEKTERDKLKTVLRYRVKKVNAT